MHREELCPWLVDNMESGIHVPGFGLGKELELVCSIYQKMPLTGHIHILVMELWHLAVQEVCG